MGYLKIEQKLVTKDIAEKMVEICPFDAMSYENEELKIGAGCKMCKLCVKKGEPGVVTFIEEETEQINKALWNGITVYAEQENGQVHPVTYELIGKAIELAKVNAEPVYVLLIGHDMKDAAKELLHYGVDTVFCYDSPELSDFLIGPYTNALEDFVNKMKPSVIMIGATLIGRSFAPRAAARFRTGLTADCTVLERKS